MRNNFLLSAGIVCLASALLHTVGGQFTLVNPMLQSDLNVQAQTEWLGAWHLITILLWVFGYLLFTNGRRFRKDQLSVIHLIGWLCLLFGFSFIGASLYQQVHAPQYILFLPIALLTFMGVKKITIA